MADPTTKQAVKDIVGADAYETRVKSGTRRNALYGGTEGENAERDLGQGDRPSRIRKRYRGARTADIDLPKEKTYEERARSMQVAKAEIERRSQKELAARKRKATSRAPRRSSR